MSLNDFLEEIRGFDPVRKKRWVVGLSAAVMVIIVMLWALSFGTVLHGSAALAPLERERAQGVSPWETIKSGTAFIYANFRDTITSLFRTFSSSRTYLINPQSEQ